MSKRHPFTAQRLKLRRPVLLRRRYPRVPRLIKAVYTLLTLFSGPKGTK